MCLSAFVSALGSHEMERHKLPIIIFLSSSLLLLIFPRAKPTQVPMGYIASTQFVTPTQAEIPESRQ